jgi:sn-glycerol 3-phosphate transport system permease protein
MDSLELRHLSKAKAKLKPYLYILPALLFVFTFTYYPFARTIYNSFFSLNVYGETVRFLGTLNYQDVLNNSNFYNALKNSLKYTAIGVPSSILISLLLALLTQKRQFLGRVSQVMLSLPMAISMSATCMIFKLLLNPLVGYLNYALDLDIQWFGSRSTALFSLVLVSVWMSIGFQYIFLLAALRGVPQDLLEAASIEGANAFYSNVRIVLPMISPTIFYLLCTETISYMLMVGPTMVLTRGGPFKSTVTLIYHMYEQSMYNQFWGYGYALSVVIFAILFLIILLTFRLENKGVHYS